MADSSPKIVFRSKSKKPLRKRNDSEEESEEETNIRLTSNIKFS